MSRIRKYLKTEMDVEIFACTHGASMILIYGFMMWLAGEPVIPFSVIVEVLILGYAMAWTQKALFLREKEYKKWEYVMREILWNLLPILYMPIAGWLCRWFVGMPMWVKIGFYGIMDCYVVLVWLFLRYVNKEDTQELNQLIQQRKNSAKNKAVDKEERNESCD